MEKQSLNQIKNMGLPWIILAPLPIDSLKLSVDEQKQKNKDQLSLGLKMKSTDSSNVQLKQALQKQNAFKSVLKSQKVHENQIDNIQQLTINGGQITNGRQTTFFQNNSTDSTPTCSIVKNASKNEILKNDKLQRGQRFSSQARHLKEIQKQEIPISSKDNTQILKFDSKKSSRDAGKIQNFGKNNDLKNMISQSTFSNAGFSKQCNIEQQIQNQTILTNLSAKLCLDMLDPQEKNKKQESFRNNQNLKPGKLIKSQRQTRAQLMNNQQKIQNLNNPIILSSLKMPGNTITNYQSLQSKTYSSEHLQQESKSKQEHVLEIIRQQNLLKGKLIVPKSTQNINNSKYFQSNQNLDELKKVKEKPMNSGRSIQVQDQQVALPLIQQKEQNSASISSRKNNQTGGVSHQSIQNDQSNNSSRQTNRKSVRSIRSKQANIDKSVLKPPKIESVKQTNFNKNKNEFDQILKDFVFEEQRTVLNKKMINLKKTLEMEDSRIDLQETTMNTQLNSQSNSILNQTKFQNKLIEQKVKADKQITLNSNSSKKRKVNKCSNRSSPSKINNKQTLQLNFNDEFQDDSLDKIIVEQRISQRKIKKDFLINDESLNFDSNLAPSIILNNSNQNKKDIFIDFQNQSKNKRYQCENQEEDAHLNQQENSKLSQNLKIYPLIYSLGDNKLLQATIYKLNNNIQQKSVFLQCLQKKNKNLPFIQKGLQNYSRQNQNQEKEIQQLKKQIASLEKKNTDLQNILKSKEEMEHQLRDLKQKNEIKKKKFPQRNNKLMNKDLNHLNLEQDQIQNENVQAKKANRVFSEDQKNKSEIIQKKQETQNVKIMNHAKKGSQHIQKQQYFINHDEVQNYDVEIKNQKLQGINNNEQNLQNNYNSNQSIHQLQNKNLQTFQSNEFVNHNKKVVMSSGNQSGYLQRRMKPLISQNNNFIMNLQSQNFQNSRSNFNAIQNPRIVSQDFIVPYQQLSGNPIQQYFQNQFNLANDPQRSRARSSGINYSRKYQLLNKQMIHIQQVDQDQNHAENDFQNHQCPIIGQQINDEQNQINNINKLGRLKDHNFLRSEGGQDLQQTSLDKISNILSMKEGVNQPFVFMNKRIKSKNQLGSKEMNMKNKYELVRKQLNQTEVHQYQSNQSDDEAEQYIYEDVGQQYLSIKKKQSFDIASDQHYQFKRQNPHFFNQNGIQQSLSGTNIVQENENVQFYQNFGHPALLKSNDSTNLKFQDFKKKVSSVENKAQYKINRKNKKSCGWLVNACSDNGRQENDINERNSMDYEEDINHLTLQTIDPLNNTIESIRQNMDLFNKQTQQISGEQTLKRLISNDNLQSTMIEQYNLQFQYNSQNLVDQGYKLQKKPSIKELNEDDPILSNSAQVNANNQRKLILENNRVSQKSQLNVYQKIKNVNNKVNDSLNYQNQGIQNIETQTQKSQFDLTFSGHMHSAEQNNTQIKQEQYSCKQFNNSQKDHLEIKKVNKIQRIHEKQINPIKCETNHNFQITQENQVRGQDTSNEQINQQIKNENLQKQKNFLQPKVGKPPHSTVEINKQKKYKNDVQDIDQYPVDHQRNEILQSNIPTRNQDQILENNSSYKSQNTLKPLKSINQQMKQSKEEKKSLRQSNTEEFQNNQFGEACVKSSCIQVSKEIQDPQISSKSLNKAAALSLNDKHTSASDKNSSTFQAKQPSNKNLISLSDSKNDIDAYFQQNQDQEYVCKRILQKEEICPLATFGNLNFVNNEDQIEKQSQKQNVQKVIQMEEKRNSQKIFQNNLEKCMNQSMSSNGAQSGNFNILNPNSSKNNLINPKNSRLNKKRFPKDFFEKKDYQI